MRNLSLLFHIQLNDYKKEKVDKFSIHRLPGGRPGISGSCVGGSNVGINLSSSKEKQKAAATAIEYMTKRETQKRVTMNDNVVSGINSLYDEDEVCQKVNCKLIKSIQHVNRPTHVNSDYDSYSAIFRTHIFDFLYGNKTAVEVLNEINDYTRIYNVSLNTDETYYGLIITIILYFWIVSIFGSMLILSAGFLELGKITETKCQIKWTMFSLGLTLSLIPVLYKLLVNFPETNKYSIWISNNRYIFLGIFVLVDLLTSVISIFQPYGVTKVDGLTSKNFEKCEINSTIQKIVQFITISFKTIILIVFLFLIFIEWNNKTISNDIRVLVGAIYFSFFVDLFIIISSSLTINDYQAVFIINEIIFILNAISNYVFIYGYKIILPFILNEEEDILKGNIRMNTSMTKHESMTSTHTRESEAKRSSFLSRLSKKIMEYHYHSQSMLSVNNEHHKSSKIDNTIISDNRISGMSDNAINITSNISSNILP
ncbi:hypothetical protein PIROE2DRAFT_16032 [Piromyces sp. E2]|nr:hypothetical protein PIROE2DRAFT_16032 [Piromyces sp. E2]|eukprot:OUM58627.1 hypothetical protein PIROE2DRAFT_16032 [Piromyces sp. E2]